MRLRDRLAALVAGREPVPDGFAGTLATGERVVADARGPHGSVVLATDRGLWLPPSGHAAQRSWTIETGHAAERSWTIGTGHAAERDGTHGPDAEPSARCVPWHLVSRARWEGGKLEVVEADAEDLGGGVVLLTDTAPHRVPLTESGRVPETVQRRVTDPIRSRQHHEIADGGAWFVQRRVPGQGVVVQVRPDPGTDPDAVRAIAVGVGEKLRAAGR